VKAYTQEEIDIINESYEVGCSAQQISDMLYEDTGIRRSYSGIWGKIKVPEPEKIKVSEPLSETYRIIVPTSGGKDSLACLLLARESFPNAIILSVFNDTGWEHPLTYSYLDYLEKELNIGILRTYKYSLPELIVKAGMFPRWNVRFCTSKLKQNTFRDYYRDFIYDGSNWEVWFGMRQEESVTRSRKYVGIVYEDLFSPSDMFPNVYSKKLSKTLRFRLPVADWTESEIFAYIESCGVDVNPLYAAGNARVGCYPCMLASKKAQHAMLDTEFGLVRLAEIRELEQKIGKKYEMYDTDQGSCALCRI